MPRNPMNNILNYIEFGHNCIQGENSLPNKFLMDYAKVMNALNNVRRGGYFYFVGVITNRSPSIQYQIIYYLPMATKSI